MTERFALLPMQALAASRQRRPESTISNSSSCGWKDSSVSRLRHAVDRAISTLDEARQHDDRCRKFYDGALQAAGALPRRSQLIPSGHIVGLSLRLYDPEAVRQWRRDSALPPSPTAQLGVPTDRRIQEWSRRVRPPNPYPPPSAHRMTAETWTFAPATSCRTGRSWRRPISRRATASAIPSSSPAPAWPA